MLLLVGWYLLRRSRHSSAPNGAAAAIPPAGEVRGKDFIDPESGSDTGSGGSGAKSSIPCFPWSKQQQDDNRCGQRCLSTFCPAPAQNCCGRLASLRSPVVPSGPGVLSEPGNQCRQRHALRLPMSRPWGRPQQGDSPGEVYDGGAIFRDSKQLQQGSAVKAPLPGSRDAFAVAANGSPDSTLLTTVASNAPLLNPFPPLPLGLPMVRSDRCASPIVLHIHAVSRLNHAHNFHCQGLVLRCPSSFICGG